MCIRLSHVFSVISAKKAKGVKEAKGRKVKVFLLYLTWKTPNNCGLQKLKAIHYKFPSWFYTSPICWSFKDVAYSYQFLAIQHQTMASLGDKFGREKLFNCKIIAQKKIFQRWRGDIITKVKNK